MKKDIILSGVGGQGILSIATVIGKAALKEGLYMKQAEVHGMSQRGGDVQSNLRISDKPIASDLIPSGKCDLIISLEPMEGLRYLPYLSPEGWLVTNETPFVNIPNYPEEDKVMAERSRFCTSCQYRFAGRNHSIPRHRLRESTRQYPRNLPAQRRSYCRNES